MRDLVMRPIKTGEKMNPPSDQEAKIGDVSAERYIVQWIVEGKPVAEAYQTHDLAVEKTIELFDQYGPGLEIEVHLNRVNPPPSVLYNGKWLRNRYQERRGKA